MRYAERHNSRDRCVISPNIRRPGSWSQLPVAGRVLGALVQARTLANWNALAERIERLAFGTVAPFDALAPALGVRGDVVAGARTAIAAHLIRLAAVAVHT